MGTNKPVLSVVIPTLGRAAVLQKCLESLDRQTNRDFEVIVVIPDPAELPSSAVAGCRVAVRVIAQQGTGLAQARNTGLRAARGEYVSFIDDDVTAAAGWAGEIISTFERFPGAGGVSGPTIIDESALLQRDIMAFHARGASNPFFRIVRALYNEVVLEGAAESVGRIFKSGAFSLGANRPSCVNLPECVEVDYLEACNMTFRRDVIERIGGFDPAYAGIGDWSEPDLAFRVRAAGYTLRFNPRARVDHHISRSGVFSDRGKDSFRRMVNFIRFYFTWIRPGTLDNAARFGVNLLFLNAYWVYKAASTLSAYWLLGLWGTCIGLAQEPFRARKAATDD